MSGVGQRARRRIAYRLLPFVFLIYVVNYIDRVNVSFANLRDERRSRLHLTLFMALAWPCST